MSQIKIPSGNDFVLELICMRQVDTETKDAFDISTCTNVSLNLYDETREDYVQLNSWALVDGTTNVIRANVEGTALQPQTKYGLVITGVDENGENFKTRIRGRNFIYVVGSISDVSANDFITNPLTIQVTMNIQGELKPVNFDDFATVEIVDEKIAAAIESIDLSDYATKNELNQTNEALSAESRTRSSVDQTLQSAVEAVGTNLSSNYYTKTQVDDIVSSITGTGGDVTKEYVDNAVSGVNATIQDIDDRYLELSQYKNEPLTFYNPGSGTVTLYFGNLGVNPDTLDWNQTESDITEFSIVVGETRYVKTADSEKTQREDYYLAAPIPPGETAVVRGIMGSTRGALSFASSGELEVAGNLCSLYNEDYLYNNYYANGFDNMFRHIDDPIYTGVEVLKVKDFSKVYLDYTNYNNDNEAWEYNILNKMFYNNEWIEKGPILVNYKIRTNPNDPAIRETFNGCRNLIEVTDYSLDTWHDWNFIFDFLAAHEPYEGYKCLTDGLTVNVPFGSAEEDKRYYQDLHSNRPDINMTINYKTDYKSPYTSNGIIIKAIDSKINDVNNNISHVNEKLDDINNNKLSGLTNKNKTEWESTDYGFTLMDDDGFDGHDNYTVDVTEGFNVENNNTNNYVRDYKGPDNKHELFEGLYNSEHIRMQFEIGSIGLWLGNPDEVSDWSTYGLKIGDENEFLTFDKTPDCQKFYRFAGGSKNYRFGWPTATATDQYEDLIATIKLDDCNYVGQAWKDAGIPEIRIYGHYLNSVWLDNNDPYQEVTDPYCKYYFRVEHDGSTDQHIYLKSDSNFVFFRCIDWQPSEYTIDRTTTNITGDLNVSGNITFNGDNNIESNISSLWTTLTHVQDLAGAAYPIIKDPLHDENNDVFIFQIQGDNKTTDYVYIYSQSTDPDNTLTGSSTIKFDYLSDPTPEYNMFIIKFKTDANFSDLSITCTNQDIKIAYIGNDLSGLEAEKTYELMVEYVYDTLTYSWAEVSTQSNS